MSQTITAIAGLSLLCLVIRLLWFVGIGFNDDMGYIHHARFLGDGGNILANGGSQLAFRLGIVLPLTFLYKLFGYSEAAFSIYPLICSLLTCIFIYLTAYILWGQRAAVFAAILWIVYPLQIVFDTQLSPSNQHATCVAGTLFFFTYATRAMENKRLPQWKGNAILFFSGVIMGLGWMMNELFIIMAVAVFPILIVLRPRVVNVLWALLGFSFIIFVDLLIANFASGSWFARIVCIDATEKVIVSNKDPNYLPRTLFRLFNVNPLHDEGHFGILWHVFLFIPLLAWTQKQWIALGMSVGVWLIIAYLQWGVVSLEGEPITKYVRYLSMIAPLQCLTVAAVCDHFIHKYRNWRWAVRSLLALFAIHLFVTGIRTVNEVQIYTEDYRKIASFLLADYKGEPVYTDQTTANFVELFSKGKLKLAAVENFAGRSNPSSGYLVVDGSIGVNEIPGYRAAMPAWYQAPPGNWNLLKVVEGKKRERYDQYDPKIYRIQ